MDEKQLFLTWNNHGSTYKSMFNMLRQKNILTDITLACDGRQFAAHQLVLATCSDYFQSILSSVSREGGGSCGGGGGHPIVYLRGVPAREMHAMLEFMYTGEAKLPQSEVKALMETAKSLRIKGLGVMPEEEEEEKGSGKEQQEKKSGDSMDQPCTVTNNRTLKSKGTKILDDQAPMKKAVPYKSLPISKKGDAKDSIQGRKRQLSVDVPRNNTTDCSSFPKNSSTHHDLSSANKVLSPKKRKTLSQENSITIVKSNRFSSPRRDLNHQGQHGTSPQVADANRTLSQDHTLTDRDTLSELVHVKCEPNYLQAGQYDEFGEGPFCSDLESILDYTVIREAKVYQNLPRSARTDFKFGHQINSRKALLKPSNEASSCLLHVQETDLQFQHPIPSSDQPLSSLNTAAKEYPIADWGTSNQHVEGSVTEASPLLREAVDGVLSLEDGGGFMASTEELYPERAGRAIQPLVGGEAEENDCSMMAGGEAHADEELLDEGDVGADMAATSIEEEAQLYLEAFTRSAGLSRSSLKLPQEEPFDDSLVHDNQESSAASVEGQEDALPANHSPPSLPFLPGGDGAEDTENRPFVCPICRKGFSKAAILKRHHLAHFRPYSCQLCQRSFTRREVLAEHLQEHSGADMRLPCPVCAMTIKRKRNLQAHIKVKHPDYYRHRVASNLAIC